jgi:TIR domain
MFKNCDALKLGATSHSRPAVREPQKRSKVVLCYAGPDREKVFQLYERFPNDGFDPWIDKKNQIPGQDWQQEIRRAISSADYFVACLSLQFRQRTFGHREIKVALDVLDTMPEGAIYLISARLEDCTIEDRHSCRQWVDLFEPEGYDKLVKALRWSESTAV